MEGRDVESSKQQVPVPVQAVPEVFLKEDQALVVAGAEAESRSSFLRSWF